MLAIIIELRSAIQFISTLAFGSGILAFFTVSLSNHAFIPRSFSGAGSRYKDGCWFWGFRRCYFLNICYWSRNNLPLAQPAGLLLSPLLATLNNIILYTLGSSAHLRIIWVTRVYLSKDALKHLQGWSATAERNLLVIQSRGLSQCSVRLAHVPSKCPKSEFDNMDMARSNEGA